MLQVDDAKEKVIMTALVAGLLLSKFLFSLSKKPLLGITDLILKV